MRKYNKLSNLLILIASVVFAIGLIAGFVFDGMYFARSGAVIVLVAVWYAYFDFNGKLVDLEHGMNHLADSQELTLIDYFMRDGKSREEAKYFYDAVRKVVDQKVPNIIQPQNKKFGIVEVVIATIGTLVWGFGDFINQLPCTG
ncbi:hypothetical protein ACK35E_12160 [Aeromonas veronii]|uniref:hypothetical protein n=1 Tax=Aeromonas sp. 603359 TaxID=2712046 RepID=UPI003A344027